MNMKMKRIVNGALSALLLISAMCLSSCSKDDNNAPVEIPQEEVRYYVKYEMEVHPWNTQAIWSTAISCLGDNGEVKLETKQTKWEATYGPISKDSHLFLQVKCSLSPSTRSDSYARIWVSRNKEPFVLKAEDRGVKSSLNATCNIDF